MRCSVRATNKQVCRSIVLMFTEHDKALLAQRMKRISDGNFARQNSGSMSCLPMPAASAPQPFIPSSKTAKLNGLNPEAYLRAVIAPHRRPPHKLKWISEQVQK
jgi:hypothetical protein